ncbi:DUF2332 domain-containing protein [Virgibacillus soli]|uniref:DUF2332 domain-containing protein n=1 Tax=Paracerasibacillus soli TaxID=480284 RepID=UPI0035EF9EB2
MDLARLSQSFQVFAERECRHSSQLYYHLAKQISRDDRLLELCKQTRSGQPVPNMLFGAVHYLLLKGKGKQQLHNYYASMTENPVDAVEAYPVFRAFCLQNEQEMTHLLQTKLVQTNEVRRCAYLLPVFSYIYEKINKPLALVEIGTSAGFQLLWDTYRYVYNGSTIGDDKDGYIISEVKGEQQPYIPKEMPSVNCRYGLDLHINDVMNAEDYLWLQALIWPEHEDRRMLFQMAANQVDRYQDELHFMEGDGVQLLPQVVDKISEDAIVCVFHTHVANQFPEALKNRLLENIRFIGKRRDIFHVYNNMWDTKLHIDSIVDKKEHKKIVGTTDGHGRWFTWEL